MSNDSVLDKDTSCHMDTDAEPQRKITNELPEGFFDDPVMDAKVYFVYYELPEHLRILEFLYMYVFAG